MMNFCTLFDSNYMVRGLALYESLCTVCNKFKLFVVAFDDVAYNKLSSLNLSNLVVEQLKEFETPELLKVKPTRTRAEYCWTCGPSVIWHFIDKYDLDSCTYLDADLMFYRSPQELFNEIGDSSVAITDHYAPYHIPQGRFCVQFMYFKNDEWGMKALNWWKDCCIEWCYARHEEGKYGDQKYLEQFPIKFKNVHIIKTRGAGIASWNMQQYLFNKNDWSFTYNEEKTNVIFVHYHALGISLNNNTLILKPTTFDITTDVEYLFEYYANLISCVYLKFQNIHIHNIKIKNRSIYKRVLSALKLKFRDNSFIRFIYENYLRPEYKGND